MLKSILINVFILLFIVTGFYITHLQAQEIKIEGKKIEYTLPYTGILPDHPLYPIKATRDRILQFLARDDAKKAKLYLLLSDKRLSMAQQLAEKGKWQLAISTLNKGEIYTSYIPDVLKQMRTQGSAPEPEFIQLARMSSEKHQEVIEDLLKDVPQGERINLENALKVNQQNQKKLFAL